MKTFGEAVLAVRGAFELLEKQKSYEDRLGPPKAHILQAAIALCDNKAALDTLEAIDSCIDRSPGTISLHLPVGAPFSSTRSDFTMNVHRNTLLLEYSTSKISFRMNFYIFAFLNFMLVWYSRPNFCSYCILFWV